jgi:hypothetical protein
LSHWAVNSSNNFPLKFSAVHTLQPITRQILAGNRLLNYGSTYISLISSSATQRYTLLPAIDF